MSTIAVATRGITSRGIAPGLAVTAEPVVSTRLRLTRRGRRVLAALVAAPVVFGLGLAIIGGGAALATREDGASAESFDTVTVMTGDSLWSIAEEVAPGSDPRDVVDGIVRLNQLDGGFITLGEQLAIPAEYAAD